MYLSVHPAATPATVSAALVAASTKDRLCNVPPGTANRLLYVGQAPARQTPPEHTTRSPTGV
jgi:hypothetical protein